MYTCVYTYTHAHTRHRLLGGQQLLPPAANLSV